MSGKKNHLTAVVDRNIKTLLEVQRQLERTGSLGERLADWITGFCGSMPYVYIHVAWFTVWIAWNTEMLGLKPFDPFPFGLLTMIVSLEAIFLSTFVLINQNRMRRATDERADLDLQINLLAEYEITKVLNLVDGIADHLGIQAGQDEELEDLKINVSPATVLKEMEKMKNRQ